MTMNALTSIGSVAAVLHFVSLTVISAQEEPQLWTSWNFSKWWQERTENTQLYSEPVIFDEPAKPAQQYGDFEKFGHVQYKPFSMYPDGVVITSTLLEVDQNFSPVTSVEVLNNTIRQYFSISRHWSDDKDYMRDLRESLKEKFLNYGLKTAFHVFKTEDNHKVERNIVDFIILWMILIFSDNV